MRYYNNFKSMTEKLISVFLVVCIVFAGIVAIAPKTVVENAYAVGVGSVEVNNDSLIGSDRTDGNIYKGNYRSFKVNLPSEPTLMSVMIGTYGAAPGACEIRLGDKNGEIIGSIDTKAVGSWAVKEYTISLTKEIVGEQTITFVGLAGVCGISNFSFWLPGLNGGRYPTYPYADRFVDISDLEQRDEINMINELGIVDDTADDRFDPNMAVTRGEFALYLSRLYNVSGGTYAADIFTDLPKTNEYCEPVSTLVQFGVVSQEATKFRPYDFITLEEAVDWIVEASGFEMRDERRTKMYFAEKKDLLDEVNTSVKYITRADMAALIFNLISSDPAEVEYYYGDVEFYASVGNVLDGRNIYYAEGFLEANELFSVNSNEEVAESNSVIIDGKTYWQNKCYAASSYVGMRVRYFYEQIGDGTPTVLAIAPSENNRVVAVDGNESDFVEINNNMISYYESDTSRKPVEVNLNSSTRIMYNDKLIESDISELLTKDAVTRPEDFRGKIYLIDYDNDRVYDVVRVYNSYSIIFGGISDEGVNDILRSNDDDPDNDLVPFDSIDDVMLYKNDVMTDYKSMIYGDAFDIYRTHNEKGKKMFRIIITSDIEDTVFVGEEDGLYVTDKGEKLEVYPDVAEDFDIEFGKEYSVQKNQFGQVILAKPYLNDEYGVFLDAAFEEDAFGDYKASIKLVDSNGVEKIYPVAQKAYIEGALLKTGVSQKAALELVPTGEDSSGRYVVCKYRVNNNNEVNFLDTPVMGPNSAQYNRDARDRLSSITGDAVVEGLQPKGNLYVNVSTNRVGTYPVASNITKFIRYTTEGSSEATWTITNTLGSEDGNVKSEIFADDDDENAFGQFVIQYRETNTNSCTQYRIINNVSYSVDENGDEVINLHLLASSADAKVKVQKNAFDNDPLFAAKAKLLKKGDVILASLDSNGDVQDFLYVYYVDGAASRALDGYTIYSVLNNTDIYNGKSNDKENTTINELTNGHMRHGEVLAVNGNFIKYKWWTKSGEGFTETVEWAYCVAGNVILVTENEYGDIKIENKKGVENFAKGDHVLIPHARLTYSCSSPIILRTHALNNPMEVE